MQTTLFDTYALRFNYDGNFRQYERKVGGITIEESAVVSAAILFNGKEVFRVGFNYRERFAAKEKLLKVVENLNKGIGLDAFNSLVLKQKRITISKFVLIFNHYD